MIARAFIISFGLLAGLGGLGLLGFIWCYTGSAFGGDLGIILQMGCGLMLLMTGVAIGDLRE